MSKTNWKRGMKVRVSPRYYEAGKTGVCLGAPVFVEQFWLPVKWDGEDDPDFFKLSGIERDE